MDDIIKMVKDKAHISDEAARDAVNTVVGYLKNKLPSPIASQIDNVIGGNQGSKMGGGMFGQ